jgi:hypothetical protein
MAQRSKDMRSSVVSLISWRLVAGACSSTDLDACSKPNGNE